MKTGFICCLLLVAGAAMAQEAKYRARVSARYVKIMNVESSLALSAKYKSDKGIEPVSGLEFHVYQKDLQGTLSLLGIATSNAQGKAKFVLPGGNSVDEIKHPDFRYVVKIESQRRFEDAEIELTVLDSELQATLQTRDSVHQITAILTDASSRPIAGQPLSLKLQRMFAPLPIGEGSYETDENGSITVILNEPMPGLDGVLTFEVVLNESDQYGTVKTLITAPIGIPIKDQSTFDKRTMWSPPVKTPYYLLIFPNLIILGVWIPLLILVFNLFRISNAKTKSS